MSGQSKTESQKSKLDQFYRKVLWNLDCMLTVPSGPGAIMLNYVQAMEPKKNTSNWQESARKRSNQSFR